MYKLHVWTCTVTIYRAVNYNWSPFVCLIGFSLCILVGRIGLAAQFRLQLIIHNDTVMIKYCSLLYTMSFIIDCVCYDLHYPDIVLLAMYSQNIWLVQVLYMYVHVLFY